MGKKLPTFVTSLRCDLRIVAQILLFWEHKGITIRSRSHLLNLIINSFADMITAKDPASEIHDTEYALRILRERGLMDDPIRNKATILQELSLENVGRETEAKTVMSETEEEEAERIMESL